MDSPIANPGGVVAGQRSQETLNGTLGDHAGSNRSGTIPDVSVVIVGTNERDLIRSCLASLFRCDQGVVFEVVVVDNVSTDGTAAMLVEQFPSVRIVRNARRLPRSANNNIGTAAAHGAYILWLDPDTVVRPNALGTMLAFLREHPEAGAVGPQLVNPDDSYQLSARTYPTLAVLLARRSPLGRTAWGRAVLRRHLMEEWGHNTVRDVDWMQGAALLIPRPVLEMVGPNDPRYMRYVEDMDWCFRAHKLGWRIYYVPTAKVEHLYRRASAGTLLSRKKLLTVWYHLFGWLYFCGRYRVYPHIKRTVDLLVAAFAILLAAPFALILAACIKLETPGPAISRQVRVGTHGRPFTLYKFRSMRHGADNLQPALPDVNRRPNTALQNRKDPRLTLMGRLMSRFSIDGLPQFMNVLLGQMSLIGPRLALPAEVAAYTERERRRLLVPPGLTGLWRVNGHADIPGDERIDLDLQYIACQSPAMDLDILRRTVAAVLSGKEAC